jgi:hypothetical protein
MSNCSENINPLIRNGTSQTQRVLPKLSPNSVEIIDKSTEDWMVWASKFSDNIKFTTLNNAFAGTMKPFFAANVSAQMARVAGYQVNDLAQFIREQFLHIETENTALKKAYTNLFDVIFTYISTVDQLLQLTKPDLEYHAILLNHVRAKLLPLEKRAFAYYKASLEGPAANVMITDSSPIEVHIFHEKIKGHLNILVEGLSSLNGIRYLVTSDFTTYYTAIAADSTILGDLVNFQDKIKYAAQHNFFSGILDEINASVGFIVKLTQKYIAKYLSEWPNHPPHYALYLTWLNLLNATTQHTNELTGRHLDFYYKDVLRLKPLAQSPDKAFLVMELNKITNSFAIPEAREFIGPKDDNGNNIIYKSTRETVLNKASIKHLSAIFFGDEKDNIGTQINNGRLFAAPIINSADGLGEKLDASVLAWHPFHIKQYLNSNLSKINMPFAEIGFAVSSHYLRLKEGKRQITLEVNISNHVVFNNFAYQAFVTTEKKWLEITDSNLVLTKGAGGKVTKLTFNFTISAENDSIVAYNNAIHLGRLTTVEPVLKILLKHNNQVPFIYNALSTAQISTINLKVKVGEINGSYNEDGIKNLELHNDTSPLNSAKPFHPWGPEPTIGNSFIFGSDEIFYKKGAKIQLNFNWKNYPLNDAGEVNLSHLDYDVNPSTVKFISFNSTNRTKTGDDGYVPHVEILKLSKNKWVSLQNNMQVFRNSATAPILEKVALNIDLSASTHNELFLDKNQSWNGYSANSNKGFIRLKLNNDFGHRDYYLALQSFYKLNVDSATAPAYPYQPTLQSFSISYEATTSLNVGDLNAVTFENRNLSFFHNGPFGDSEQHKFLQQTNSSLVNNLITKTNNAFPAQGSLFIGLENLFPGDTQSILFQIQEGSEDPLLDKPENHLQWQYLAKNNVWKNFSEDEVGDNTSGWIESGLINFIIPKDATLEHTAFQTNLIWIRVAVAELPNAVAKIIGIYPNAIEVQRAIPANTEYGNMVAAASEIKKLYQPEAKIKKIEQPFASFNGKPIEPSEAFYLRASERLRHKNRAITIWDFERLVLQAFPEIYKVKCLNHTKIEGALSEGNLVYNEVAPGYVTVITIPNLASRNDIEPLKPYTKKSTLKQIEDFLKARSSCQVKITAAQPDFEEVKVKCKIVLRNEYSDVNYYKATIQQDITQFLSPWAFKSESEIQFGGRIHQSVLIDFIEELPYVDYLTDFEIIHIQSNGVSKKVQEAVASTARSVLVSVPAGEHQLNVSLKVNQPTEAIDCNNE